MTKLFLLFLVYSVIAALIKRRAQKKAEENAAGNGPTQKPKPMPKKEIGRKTIETERDAPPLAPEAGSKTFKGKQVLPGVDDEVHDEHHRSRRDTPRWERDEHSPSPFKPSQTAKSSPNPIRSPNETTNPARSQPPGSIRSAGREVLDILAKELGLPLPEQEKPVLQAPAAKPKPTAEGEGSRANPPNTTRFANDWEGRNQARDSRQRTSSPSSKPPGHDPYLKQVNPGIAESRRLTAVTGESLRNPDEVARAIVLQSVMGEPPGMRYWHRRSNPKP